MRVGAAMHEEILTDRWRRLFNASFWMTFYLFSLYVLFFIVVVVLIAFGFMTREDEILLYVTYAVGCGLFLCVVIMMFYPLIFISYLWRKGEKKKSLNGMLVFFFLNILTGYIWFFIREVKRQEIKLSVF